MTLRLRLHVSGKIRISGCLSSGYRPSVYTKTIEVYAIRSNTLPYLELFENDFKGGSSGCPGALRTCVNGGSGYLYVFPCLLRMRSAVSFDLKPVFSSFCKLQKLLFALFLSFDSTSDLKVFHIASSILKASSHPLTGPGRSIILCCV